MSTTCTTCNRDPKRVNNEHGECSHRDCPHRRRCWSERPEHAAHFPFEPKHPLDQLFDKETDE